MSVIPEARLADHEIRQAGEVASHNGRLMPACRHALATEGKQLRASIVFEAAKYGPRSDAGAVRQAAIAIEVLHLATLTHDDVVDDGKLRRGRDTVGARFGNLHAALGGGWLFGRALELMAGCGDRAVALSSATAIRICEGEMLEVQDLYDSGRTPARYFAAVEGKTASLFSLSARLGAELAGADNEVTARLERYGHELGVAFQISDDVLDLVGEAEVTGKKPGEDLRRGIYTLPVIYALAESAQLRQPLARRFEENELQQIVAAVKRTNGIERAIDDCRLHAESAKAALAGLPDPGPLIQLVGYAVDRCREA